MVYRRKDQVIVTLKRLPLCQGQIHVVGSADDLYNFIIGTVRTSLLKPVGGHNRMHSFLPVAFVLLFVRFQVEIVSKLAWFLLLHSALLLAKLV